MSGWQGFVKGRLGACLLTAVVLTASCSSGSDLTKEDINKLELGMPVSEAESILGLKFEGVKEVSILGLPLTSGRFGPEDGPHIAVIAQDLDGLEIRQLEWVEDGESVCIRTFEEDTCAGGG